MGKNNGLGILTKKFIGLMKREVDLNREVNGRAALKEVGKNVASKFRINTKEVFQIADELNRRKVIEASTEKSRRKRKTIRFL